MLRVSVARFVLNALLLASYCFLLINYIKSNQYLWFIDNVNLAIHEAGHLLFMFFGEFIGILGGTILQIALPVITVTAFIKQEDRFAVTFSIVWLGTNMFSVARYLADAQNQLLPLVHLGGGEPIHDWNYLLAHLNLLDQCGFISGVIYALGYLLIVGAIFYGAFLLARQRSLLSQG
jgi:hypothetical protein